jgi:hypothetical protein
VTSSEFHVCVSMTASLFLRHISLSCMPEHRYTVWDYEFELWFATNDVAANSDKDQRHHNGLVNSRTPFTSSNPHLQFSQSHISFQDIYRSSLVCSNSKKHPSVCSSLFDAHDERTLWCFFGMVWPGGNVSSFWIRDEDHAEWTTIPLACINNM